MQGSKVVGRGLWERIHLFQLFILNEHAARYAVAPHYVGFVDVDEYRLHNVLPFFCVELHASRPPLYST